MATIISIPDEKTRAASSRLTRFVCLLLQEFLTVGEVEAIIAELQHAQPPVNEHLMKLAEHIAKRILGDSA